MVVSATEEQFSYSQNMSSENGGAGSYSQNRCAVMNGSSATIVPEIHLTASFIVNSFYFKIHVSTGNVFQTMNTFALFKGRSST